MINRDIEKRRCEEMPKDINEAVKWTISRIKHNTIPSKDKILKRRAGKLFNDGGVDDDFSLDKYYVGLINNALEEIRMGRQAYLFTVRQIEDVLRFETGAKFTYIENADCVQVEL